jgi:hypothetical protein
LGGVPMSFVHTSIVGHFDPRDIESLSQHCWPLPIRPLDVRRARELLASLGDAVSRCVGFEDGRAWCEWSAGRSPAICDRVREYAERLADQESAIILESPPFWVRYPPEAATQFKEAVTAWQARRGEFP